MGVFTAIKVIKTVLGLAAGPLSKTYLSAKQMKLNAALEEKKSANAARKNELDAEIERLRAEIHDMEGQRAHYRATHGAWWQQLPLFAVECTASYAFAVMVLREAHRYAGTPEWTAETWYLIGAVILGMIGRRGLKEHMAARKMR